jgi:cycloeucalenol cycloisomerase
MAFFTVYHIAAIVVIRRLYNISSGASAAVRRLTYVLAVAATAFFFAWAETFFYMTAPAHDNVWYIDLHQQLYVGSFFYAMDFIFTFPNVYRLDERADKAPWSIPRLFVEPAAMAMFILLADDLWTMFSGAPFA